MTPMKIPSRGGVARSATVVVERRGGSVAATLLDPVQQKALRSHAKVDNWERGRPIRIRQLSSIFMFRWCAEEHGWLP